jgi:hypothetical protein
MGLSGLAVVGYLTNDPSLYYLTTRSNGMAIRSAASFMLLGLAFVVLGMRPHTEHQPIPAEGTHVS